MLGRKASRWPDGEDLVGDLPYAPVSVALSWAEYAVSCAHPDGIAAAEAASSVPGRPEADLLIPGAEYYNATSTTQGTYYHGVIASKGGFVFVIDAATGSAAPVPLLETMARQQYAAL